MSVWPAQVLWMSSWRPAARGLCSSGQCRNTKRQCWCCRPLNLFDNRPSNNRPVIDQCPSIRFAIHLCPPIGRHNALWRTPSWLNSPLKFRLPCGRRCRSRDLRQKRSMTTRPSMSLLLSTSGLAGYDSAIYYLFGDCRGRSRDSQALGV